jgi:branched-chain amino acid transport system substrate-binding protein
MKYWRGLLCFLFATLLVTWGIGSWAKDIVIGYSAPLSGPAAEYGLDCVNGVEMAVSEINAAGGIVVKGQRYTFKLERLDDRVDPTQAVNNARRFVSNKAIAVFNPVFSTLSGIMKINQESGSEFLVMAYTSTPKAAKLGNKLTAVITVPFTVYVQVFAERAWKVGWRKIGMLITLGAYGDEWREAFKEAWTKKGGTITADKPANYYRETDYSAQLTAILQTKPEAILIGGPSSSTSLVVEQARNLGFKGGFVIIDQARMDTMARILKGTSKLENAIGIGSVADFPGPGARRLAYKYKATYKRFLTWEVALNYNGMYILSKAIVAAGTVNDVKAIMAALPKAFPILGDKSAAEEFGMTSYRVFEVPASVQTVRYRRFTQSVTYDWWSKTIEDYHKARRLTKYHVPFLWFRYEE